MGTLLLIAALLLVWIIFRIQPLFGHAHMERLENFHSSLAADRDKVVICVGDSLTHGNVGFDYVHVLASRLEPWGYTVLNAGINSELAWNVLQRADRIISADPAFVILLVGTNDARGCEDEGAGKRYVKDMKLPQAPSEDFFFDSYRELLDEFGELNEARLVTVTLPPLGERSGEEIDAVTDRFNAFVEEEARQRGHPCVSLGRALREQLLADAFEDTPAYSAKASNRLVLSALFRRYLLGWDWQRISEGQRLKLLTDTIHLNELSGGILVDLVEAEIQRRPEGSG